MAISTHRVTINPQDLGTWSRVDVINQLEDAFTWLDWHGPAESGLVCGIASFTGGGTLSGDTNLYYYEDVRPISTSGIGSGASFFVARREDVGYVTLNRPGTNYVPGDTVTLSAEDIGGSANGATDIEVRVVIAGEVTGGLGYGITVTGTYDTEGTDRNGFVTGSNATITIREGDTLTFENRSGRGLNIISSGAHFTEDFRGYYESIVDTYYEGLVFNVIGNRNTSSSGDITRWTPLPGQRGTYYVTDDWSSYGSFNPTIVVEPAPSGITTNTYGSSGFYSKDVADTSEPWGVLKQTINASKTYGSTYRVFGFNGDNTNLYLWSGSSFFPDKFRSSDTTSWRYPTGHGFEKRFGGLANADISYANIRDQSSNQGYSSPVYMDRFDNIHVDNGTDKLNIGGTTSRQLDLNIFRSSIDPNFAVLSFNIPTAAASKLRDRATFFLHNFETSVWDLDEVFLSGYTEIFPSSNDNEPYLVFRNFLTGTGLENSNYLKYFPPKRCAEFGYVMIQANDDEPGDEYFPCFDDTYYRSNTLDTYYKDPYTGSVRAYYRDSSRDSRAKTYPNTSDTFDNVNRLSSDLDFNAVIKGIPLSAKLIPVPYYLPDDFVLIDFYYNVPGVNIQQGDTITISGSEQYTVIQGSYNQSGSTKGILFCGRSV
jgi:hypothetical protein